MVKRGMQIHNLLTDKQKEEAYWTVLKNFIPLQQIVFLHQLVYDTSPPAHRYTFARKAEQSFRLRTAPTLHTSGRRNEGAFSG